MPKFLKEITFSGQSTPPTPTSGYGSVYIDGPTNLLYYINDAGVTYDLTSGGTDTYITGFTYDNANTLTIEQNNAQPDLSVLINTMTGLTVNGNLSATTYENLPIDVFVTGGTYSAGTASFINNTGGTFNLTGFGLKWYSENAAAPAVAPTATGAASIAFGSNTEALAADMFVYGNCAGYQATNASNSNFFGSRAGCSATYASNSNFFGTSAGISATYASNSNFFGPSAGCGATNASNSNFFGTSAGQKATNAGYSNFFGPSAGVGATNAGYSNFFGSRAGCLATNAGYSNFFGPSAGGGATKASNSNFFGSRAGYSATYASNSNFFGSRAGYSATYASNSNFFGSRAGCSATYACNSNFFGLEAGNSATYACNSNFFGLEAGNSATNASNSNFFGTSAGQSATNAGYSNFFGTNAGGGATNAGYSNFFGLEAGNSATYASNSNFFGTSAGFSATNASNSNFFGRLAGQCATGSCYSTFIGYQVGKCFTNNNLGRNNIIVGTNITLPNNTCDSLNVGSTLFGSQLYFNTASLIPFTGVTSSGRIGVGVINPTNTFHISGATNPLRIEGLLTSANTNYLVANSDGVVTLTSGSSGSDTYVTGFTYNNANTLTIQQNNGQPDLTASINIMTGLTIIGNLSATTIDTTYIDFVPLTARPVHTEARVYWYDDEKTLELQTENANFNLEVGHQTVVRVRNTTGSPLTKGSLVYINGGSGNNPTVTLASYEADSNSARTLGYVAVTIPDNQFGYVITNGMLRDVDTSAYSAGTQLYLFTGGTYTNVRPIAPLHEVRVGIVVRQSATVGIIFVSIMNGYELAELHDVRVTGETNNDLLQYNSSISAWTNTQNIQITSLTANTISATTYQNLPSEILKKTNIILTSTTWVSGATWTYNYNDSDVSSGDTIIFTPDNSTINVVINAIILPQITTSGGTFTLYAQNQPSGNINGEYLIIKT